MITRSRHAGGRRGLLAAALGLVAVGLSSRAAAQAPEARRPDPDPAPSRPVDQVVAVPAYRQANRVAVFTVHGAIDSLTLRSLERRTKVALADGADAIVIDFDTPGGELTATLDICHLVKTDMPANTVAWVNPQAYSAGTIIALACREIIVAPNATFGDAAPIQAGPLGIQALAPTERAKQEAPILEEVVDSARRNHYDERLVQAFVSMGVELWLLEHVQSGERVFVDRNEYRTVFGGDPPDEITPLTSSSDAQRAAPVRPWFNTAIPAEGDPRAADAAQQAAIDEHRLTLPPARPPLSMAERQDWRLLTQVTSADRLLTVRPAEAKFYGLAKATIGDDQQLQRYFGAQEIRRYDRTWSEAMVRFLTHPIVMGVLIVIFLVCLFIELASPGIGLFGATAGIALLLLVGAPFLAGMAQWWDILLIVVGLILVGAELFVIPGFGVSGVAGVAALLAGLVGIFVSGDLGTVEGQSELATGLVTTLTALLAAGIAVWLFSRQIRSWPLFNRLVLSAEVGAGHGPEVGLLAAMGGTPEANGPRVGDAGTAATDLRPAGRAEFGGRLYDVKSVGQFVEKGRPVRVVAAGRFVVEVEEAERC